MSKPKPSIREIATAVEKLLSSWLEAAVNAEPECVPSARQVAEQIVSLYFYGGRR